MNQAIEDELIHEQYHWFPGTTIVSCCIKTTRGETVVGTHVDDCDVTEFNDPRSPKQGECQAFAKQEAIKQLLDQRDKK